MSTDVLLAVALLIIQVFCTVIPIINKKRELDGTLKYGNGDKFMIGLSIIGLGLAILLLLNAKDAENEKKIEASKASEALNLGLAARDEVHRIQDSVLSLRYGEKLDSAYLRSLKASNEALAKYNLTLVDSMRGVALKINSSREPTPVFEVTPYDRMLGNPVYVKLEDGKEFLKIRFQSYNFPSYNIQLTWCIIKAAGNMVYPDKSGCYILPKKPVLVNDIESTLTIPLDPKWKTESNAVIVLTGKYSTDADGMKVKNYSQAFYFDFVTGRLGNKIENDLDGFVKIFRDLKILP